MRNPFRPSVGAAYPARDKRLIVGYLRAESWWRILRSAWFSKRWTDADARLWLRGEIAPSTGAMFCPHCPYMVTRTREGDLYVCTKCGSIGPASEALTFAQAVASEFGMARDG